MVRAPFVIIIALARFFSDKAHLRGFSLKELIAPGLLLAVPALLIMKQPDLGTAILIASSGLIALFLAGITALIAVPLALFLGITAALKRNSIYGVFSISIFRL